MKRSSGGLASRLELSGWMFSQRLFYKQWGRLWLMMSDQKLRGDECIRSTTVGRDNNSVTPGKKMCWTFSLQPVLPVKNASWFLNRRGHSFRSPSVFNLQEVILWNTICLIGTSEANGRADFLRTCETKYGSPSIILTGFTRAWSPRSTARHRLQFRHEAAESPMRGYILDNQAMAAFR